MEINIKEEEIFCGLFLLINFLTFMISQSFSPVCQGLELYAAVQSGLNLAQEGTASWPISILLSEFV